MLSHALLIMLLALGCRQGLLAQGFQPFSAGVTVRGVPLDNPWAGGLNAPQLSTADFNRDGMEVWRPYAEWLGPLEQVLGELAAG